MSSATHPGPRSSPRGGPENGSPNGLRPKSEHLREQAKGAARQVGKWASIYHPRVWKEKGLWWTLGVLLLTYMAIVTVLAIYWSRTPDALDVREAAREIAEGDELGLVTGSYTAATAIRIAETLLYKPGGYLSNDKLPPGVLLDNIPNWEYGALVALRDLLESMRNEFSRSQSQSVADPDLEVAQPAFNYDSNSWILPSTESEYKRGIKALKSYMARLADENQTDAQFFARADNLASYLGRVTMRLGNYGNQLSFAAGAPTYNTVRVGEPGALESTPIAESSVRKTPWLEIDDVFFEARGYAWGLLEILQAAKIDFESVLKNKTAVVPLDQVMDSLHASQQPIRSPLILNGKGFGLFANHSLVLSSYISRANAGVINLYQLLQRG